MADAETCFMTVLVHRPRWVEGEFFRVLHFPSICIFFNCLPFSSTLIFNAGWGILFLFYQKNKNPGGMAFAEDMARQYLNDERTDQDYFMKNEELIWTSTILPRTVFFKTAVVLLKLRIYYVSYIRPDVRYFRTEAKLEIDDASYSKRFKKMVESVFFNDYLKF